MGPEPAAVYWRRRAAVVTGLVVVIIVLVMIIKALASSGDGDAKTPTAAPATKTASSAPPGGDPKAAAACATEQLTGGKLASGADILLVKDKESYAPGEPVTMKASVKNTSSKDCSLLNNAHNVVLHVVSGDDRIFDSADCAAAVPEDSGDLVTFKAGETTEIAITWEPTRSQQNCPEINETPFRAKDANYTATITIAGVASDATQFLLVP